MKANFHNFHFDYVKIRLPKVDKTKINWNNLKSHPNLRRHYILSKETGLKFFKNFDLFLNGRGYGIIRLSMPYLFFGHNYISFDTDDVLFCVNELQRILGVSFDNALIEEFEYGCFESLDTTCRKHLNNIQSMPAYDLVKSTPNIRIFDNGMGVKYKVYDAIANAKRKKTFKRAGFSYQNVLKHEYKMVFKESNLKPLPLGSFVHEKFIETVWDNLTGLITDSSYASSFNKELDLDNVKTVNDILFIVLKRIQQEHGIDTMRTTLNIIKGLNLTPSQKCKRTQSISNLNKKLSKK